jgi:hypothetical protein
MHHAGVLPAHARTCTAYSASASAAWRHSGAASLTALNLAKRL